jgi:hypothetical protein
VCRIFIFKKIIRKTVYKIMVGLYYYKLVSPYKEDVTKNCKLTINEIDSNFLTLKDNDIKSAEFVREEKTLVLTRNNDEKLIVPLNDIAYNLNVDAECGESGTTLTISYDGEFGKKDVVIPNILTADNLMDVIGSDILTKVITDGTLRGNGTIDAPLGITGVEKTGSFAPVLEVFDLTTGGTLPEVAKLGTRYITKEYVNDYGYLYNGAGVDKIQEKLDERYSQKSKSHQTNERRYGWRIPSKADWDALLNSVEPCEYQNHNSSKCHVELGKVAGKYFKSECGWLGQPECECTVTKPNTGCSYNEDGYIDEEPATPSYNEDSCVGIDKYGLSILPAGLSTLDTFGRPQSASFKEQAIFWTSTHVYGDSDQDVYAKIFDWNKCGVSQVAECPKPYYSVRLVKDYDGSNYYDSEYIDGVLYKTILFPESGQIWLASNYADKEGFIEYVQGGETPEIVEVNNGEVLEKRVEMFINEWNGYYWEKKIMHEGDTIVVENPCFDQGTGTTTNVCWMDKDHVSHCIDIEIPKAAQSNIEYRVFTEDGGCNKILVNTDDLVVERVVQIIVPMLEKEREERIEADAVLSGAIETERDERISGDTELWEAISQEASARTDVDNQLWDAIAQEASARTDVDNQLWDAIAQEASARTDVDNQIWSALNNEIQARLDVDAQMWAAINAEAEARETTDNLLWDAINAETARAQEVERQLWEGINGETARAQEVEAQLWGALNAEIERATARENEIDGQLIDWRLVPFTFTAAVKKDENNIVFKTKDGIEEHFIRADFDANFGSI